MRTRSSFQLVGIASVVATACTLVGCGGEETASGGSGSGSGATSSETRSAGSKLTSDDRAATDFIQGKVDACWVKTADGWTTQLQRLNVFGQPMEGVPEVLYRQYRELKFSVKPMSLTESQKLNGTTYRAEVSFPYAPTRDFRTEAHLEGPPGWSMWREDSPAMSFAVELRNGKWLTEDMEMFAGLKPDPAQIPAGK